LLFESIHEARLNPFNTFGPVPSSSIGINDFFARKRHNFVGQMKFVGLWSIENENFIEAPFINSAILGG